MKTSGCILWTKLLRLSVSNDLIDNQGIKFSEHELRDKEELSNTSPGTIG